MRFAEQFECIGKMTAKEGDLLRGCCEGALKERKRRKKRDGKRAVGVGETIIELCKKFNNKN